MKNQCFIILLLLWSVRSFGFWKLDGPFIQELVDGQLVDNHTKRLLRPIKQLDTTQKKKIYNQVYDKFYAEILADFQVNRLSYVCMYNKQTGYSIGCSFVERYPNMLEGGRFFRSRLYEKDDRCFYFGYDLSNLSDDYSGFYFVKEDPGLELNGLIKPILSTQLYGNHLREYVNVYSGINFLHDLSEFYRTENDIVQINNTNYFNLVNKYQIIKPISHEIRSSFIVIINSTKEIKVKIKRVPSFRSWFKGFFNNESKPLDFQEQLMKYFNREKKFEDFIGNVIKSIYSTEGVSAKMLNALKFASRVGEGEINRLKNSKILAVYGLMKNEKGQDAIIWGLAEDKVSRRRFQWITDLEDDISCLLRE